MNITTVVIALLDRLQQGTSNEATASRAHRLTQQIRHWRAGGLTDQVVAYRAMDVLIAEVVQLRKRYGWLVTSGEPGRRSAKTEEAKAAHIWLLCQMEWLYFETILKLSIIDRVAIGLVLADERFPGWAQRVNLNHWESKVNQRSIEAELARALALPGDIATQMGMPSHYQALAAERWSHRWRVMYGLEGEFQFASLDALLHRLWVQGARVVRVPRSAARLPY